MKHCDPILEKRLVPSSKARFRVIRELCISPYEGCAGYTFPAPLTALGRCWAHRTDNEDLEWISDSE